MQPPIKSVGWMDFKCDHGRKVEDGILEFSCKTGLTLGHLIDVFERDIQNHSCLRPRSRFSGNVQCCSITNCSGRFKGGAANDNFVLESELESSNGQAILVLTEISWKKWNEFPYFTSDDEQIVLGSLLFTQHGCRSFRACSNIERHRVPHRQASK